MSMSCSEASSALMSAETFDPNISSPPVQSDCTATFLFAHFPSPECPPRLCRNFPERHSSHSSSCLPPLFFSFLFFFLPLLQQTSNVSATLVLSRPIKGPRELVLDLEMVTVNNVINFRGSSIIRLTIYVSEHPF